MDFMQSSNAPRMVNLGCGQRVNPDWINLDQPIFWWRRMPTIAKSLRFLGLMRPENETPNAMYHDVRQGLPFEDNSIDVVYHSHLLEHLEKNQAFDLMLETYRVLKQGGVLRVVVPDLERACRSYLAALDMIRVKGDILVEDRYDRALLELIDQMVRITPGGEMIKWLAAHSRVSLPQTQKGIKAIIRRLFRRLLGLENPAKIGELHRWMYDEYSLSRLFKQSGFIHMHRTSHLESYVRNWIDYLLDNNSDGSAYKPESLYIEGLKP